MTNWLTIFLALYVLVGQPAIIWWMLDNSQLYQLAWLNAWIFLIALIISAICKPNKPKSTDNSAKVVGKSEERVSRIENDNGIAIVEVEKKTEVVVESWDAENSEDKIATVGESEEKAEEKLEEKSSEKPMRESVSIPKIVQPVSWHPTTKKRKKERKWWQRLILFLTLGIAVIIARTLREFLWHRWVAIALFLWWILYLVIGKLFDVNWFYNAKKLFTNRLYIVLVLAWIGYGVYAMQQNQSFFRSDFSQKVVSYVKDRFSLDKQETTQIDTEVYVGEDTWNIIYVFEWTGEVINDTEDEAEDLNEIWVVEDENLEDDTWIQENSESEVEAQPEIEVQPEVENQTTELSPEEAKKQVTMWEAIKAILAWTTLSTKTNSTFTYVSRSNELYPYFKTAQEKWMIGTDTDPSKIVSCETYITMKWLREWWNVWNYVKSEIKSAYWKKATELWKLNGCEKWKYVTKWNL